MLVKKLKCLQDLVNSIVDVRYYVQDILEGRSTTWWHPQKEEAIPHSIEFSSGRVGRLQVSIHDSTKRLPGSNLKINWAAGVAIGPAKHLQTKECGADTVWEFTIHTRFDTSLSEL